MNQSDKDFIGGKLALSIDLIKKDQTAAALREIADAVSVVAVALESQTSGAHSMALNDSIDGAGSVTHTHIITTQDGGRFATGHGRASRPFSAREVEESALAPVKPLCRSGLMAALSDGGKNNQCPACGLFHERRVVLVELSSLGLAMLQGSGSMRLGMAEDNPYKYQEGDRVVFSDATKHSADIIRADVIKLFSGAYGREAIIEVTKS